VIEIMARATGLEPAASGVTGRRSNQLSYARKAWNDAPSPLRLGATSPSARVREASSSVKASSQTQNMRLARGKGRLVRPAMRYARQHHTGGFDVHPALSLVVARVHEFDGTFHHLEQ
jgi:hypothetical protein